MSDAADLNLTAGAGIRPEDRLTTEAKANSADLDAAIAVAVALLSVLPIAKMLLFRRASSVAEDLVKLRSLSESRARAVVTQSIREVGVEQTAETAGLKDVYDLYKYLDPTGPEAASVLDTALALRQQAKVAAGGVTFSGQPVAPTFPNYVGWHGDNISPTALQSQGGFIAKGTNTDLFEHMLNRGEPSAFMGTTSEAITPDLEGGAAHWGAYVYEIEAGEAWDTAKIWEENQHLLSGAVRPAESEIAIRGTIPWERVRGWREVTEGTLATKVKLGPYISRAAWEATSSAAAR